MSRFFQPHVARMAGYEPGEQPRVSGFIKMNTNENPYPPSPKVAEAIDATIAEGLRKYPDPLATTFREAAARHHGVTSEMVLAGNGSDDLLTIVTRAFAGPGEIVLAPTPSYILYRTLAQIQSARFAELSFRPDWSLDLNGFRNCGARLVFIANPNSPSGTVLTKEQVAVVAGMLDCPLVLDEAYASFADFDCVDLVRDHPNLIVTRTLSKGYSLAGLRLGYLIARPDIVEGLIKVKDSYNCDALSLAGGRAALEDQGYHLATRAKIIATRRRLTEAMRSLGFSTPDSQANFIWCTGRGDAAAIYTALKERMILVRLMRYPGHEPGLRITVGTDDEIDCLLEALRTLV
jgi:histidinol-phosphate aminotransferase